jgi:hypothetical protein
MRLKQYISESYMNEEEIDKAIASIKKDCKPFFKKMGSDGEFLWRGSNSIKTFGKILTKVKPRKDRRPLDTIRDLHDYLDELFKKYHGWKARSEGVFVTPKRSLAKHFGKPYYVFPIGDFQFLYHPDSEDMVELLEPLNISLRIDVDPVARRKTPYFKHSDVEEEVAEATEKQKKLIKLIKGFKKTGLSTAVHNNSEIMLKCKSYYMAESDDRHFQSLLENLFDDMT